MVRYIFTIALFFFGQLAAAYSPLDSISISGPLYTSGMLGQPYINDSTTLHGPFKSQYHNWIPPIGNRSVLAKAIIKGPGKYGLTFCYDKRNTLKPIGFWLDRDKLSITGSDGEIILSDSLKFQILPDSAYVLQALMYGKGMFFRVEGAGSRQEITIPDRMRFQPGQTGIETDSGTILSWRVDPVGPNSPKVGAIGDSYTGGLSNEADSLDYFSLVAKGLGQTLELNFGSGGATTEDDKNRFHLEIKPFQPKVVWIESGTNDVIQGFTAERIIANLKNEIGQVNWGGRIMLSTIPPRNKNTEEQNRVRDSVNIWVRESNYAFVDRDKIVRDPLLRNSISAPLDNGDGVHVNTLGEALIASAALDILHPVTGISARNQQDRRMSVSKPYDILGRIRTTNSQPAIPPIKGYGKQAGRELTAL